MFMLKENTDLNNQMKGYSEWLQKREGFKVGKATFYALQMQDFQSSGMTPKGYFEAIKKHSKEADSFLSNFRHFNQFTQEQYFADFHELRWEIGRKYVKGDR